MAATGVGTALVVIVCCAAPGMLAAGALAGIGAWLASPWLLASAPTGL
jgi:hypothetical protein